MLKILCFLSFPPKPWNGSGKPQNGSNEYEIFHLIDGYAIEIEKNGGDQDQA
jgi:hypothetical protein